MHPAEIAETQTVPRRLKTGRNKRARVSLLGHLGWTSLVSFFVGASMPIKMDSVGVLSYGEILLVPVALWALCVMFRRGVSRALWVMSLSIGISFLGYVLTDLIRGTPYTDLTRGWARVLFLLSNLIGLHFLVRINPPNLMVYCAGLFTGTLFTVWGRALATDTWKFEFAFPVVLMAAAILPLFGKAGLIATAGALAILSVVNMDKDYRSMSAFCLIAATFLLSRTGGLSKKAFRLALIALASGMLIYEYTSTDEQYDRRRNDSNTWRTAGAMATWQSIRESPWIGHGSWTADATLIASHQQLYRASGGVWQAGMLANPHSQILQSWYEAGIIGLSFFLYFAYQLIRALRFCVTVRPLDQFSTLFVLCLCTALWHLFFSPFAGSQRVEIAIAAVVILLLKPQMRQMRNIPRYVMRSNASLRSSGDRLAVRRALATCNEV